MTNNGGQHLHRKSKIGYHDPQPESGSDPEGNTLPAPLVTPVWLPLNETFVI
jgi:hypothetical protein